MSTLYNMVAAIALIIEEHKSPFVVDTVELESLQPNEVLVKLKATGGNHLTCLLYFLC